jgi:hypothetical protein
MFRESRNVVPNRIIGYARVSKTSQTVEQQVDALRAIGVAAVYADEGVSGAQRDRDGLSAALAELQPGDALAVVALDRLGRDLSDLVGVVDGLRERGAHPAFATGEYRHDYGRRPDAVRDLRRTQRVRKSDDSRTDNGTARSQEAAGRTVETAR